MKKASKTITLISALITLSLGFFAVDTVFNAAAIAYLIWSVSPYGFLAALVNLVSNKTSEIAGLIIVIITCGFGLGLIVDAMFIHPDAQGGMAFAVVPMWQWAGLLMVTLPLVILNKAKSK